MLRSATELQGYALRAMDGDFGEVHDFYFDDQLWTVRFLVARTIALIGRKVLIAPGALGESNWGLKRLEVRLRKEQIKASPGVDLRKPVSKQVSEEVNAYYGWPVFAQDRHLRSMREVRGYRTNARDGDIGRVEDFIVDTESWTIRHMVVDTRKILAGRRVLLSPTGVAGISWEQNALYVEMTRDEVKDEKEYDPSRPVNEEIRTRRSDYRGRPHPTHP